MPNTHQFSPYTANVFKRAVLPERRSLSPGTAGFLSGTDLEGDNQGARLSLPYAQSAWVYTAISILAASIAQIPFRISRVGSGQARRVRLLRGSADPRHRAAVRALAGSTIIDSGAVVDLFNRPHVTQDRQLFWEMAVTWFALRGEMFILPLDRADQPVDLAERNPRITSLLTLEPGLFWHNVQGYELVCWRYTGSPLLSPQPSEILLPTEVIHSRSPNPYLYWRGMSPLVVAMLAAQTDFAGEQFQKGLWVNNADTGVIVTTEQQATKDQREAINVALRERKRKAGTADRPLFMWGGAKIEKPTLSMMDMQYLETRKFLRQEIFSIFKVPESLAGFTSDLNDGGAGGSIDAVKMSFTESTLGSLCSRLEAAVDPIIKTFGDDLVGWFDLDSLPIMQAARRSRWATAVTMFGIGVPLNDINKNLDLGMPEYKWGKNGYLPFNLQNASDPAEPLPAEDPAAPKPDDDDDEDDDDDDQSKGNPFERLGKLMSALRSQPAPAVAAPEQKATINVVALWQKHITARKASVQMFKGKVTKVLLKFRARTLNKLDTVHLEKTIVTKSLIDLIFNANEFGEALDHELQVPIKSTLQSAGEQVLAEIGSSDDAWKYPPKQVIEYLAGRQQKIMGVGGTVRDQLNTSLVEGVEAGETHLQLAARVKQVFGDMTDGEAKRVAMTEVNTAYNDARHQAMGDAGIQYKAWLSSHGPRVREAHAQAEEDYIDDPIPIDDAFVVMEEQLMFPGDDSMGASLENIINCQCVQLAAEKTGEDEKSVTYKIFGMGPIKFIKK